MTLALKDRERLKRLLDLSDRLGRVRRRAGEDAGPTLRKELRSEVRSIAGRIVTIGLPGTLGALEREYRLGPQEVLVLLLLLNRSIEPGDAALSGREILGTLFASTFGILRGAALLAPDGKLRASGAVEAVREGEGVLGTRFGLSEAISRAIEEDVLPNPAVREVKPYEGHFEHLADLARLTGLLLRRANAVFDTDPYGHRVAEGPETASMLDRQARAFSAAVRDRLAATPGGERFPIVELANRVGLTADEQMILVVLLVQECYYGSPGFEAVECVKMLSKTPEELLRNRSLLRMDSPLRRMGLVELEDPVDDKEITADLTLPRWVSSLLLGEVVRDRDPIGPDTRLEFHEYLKELEDSDRFFRDLDT